MDQSCETPAYAYTVPEPFERALKSLRAALSQEGLSVPVELDIAGRIRKELGVRLAPCRVLCIDNPMTLLQAMAVDTTGAIFLPLHLVVSGCGPLTVVRLFNPDTMLRVQLPPGAKTAIGKLQAQLGRAIQRVGYRQALCAS